MNRIPTTTEFAWLVRREIWEHKLVTWAPGLLALLLVVSALASFLNPQHALLIVQGEGIDSIFSAGAKHPQDLFIACVLTGITLLFLLVASAVQFFYAADALYAERAQRTILFWKSLPISDARTVLSKAMVAILVTPLIAWLASLAAELVLAVIASIQYRSVPAMLGALWNPSVWGHSIVLTFYVLVTSAVWYAPLIAWALLVSAWMPLAKGMRLGRSPILVATLIPLALVVAERVALGTHYVWNVVRDRAGVVAYAQSALGPANEVLSSADMANVDIDLDSKIAALTNELVQPLHFLAAPAVWAGLFATALMIAAAVYCRRGSENRG